MDSSLPLMLSIPMLVLYIQHKVLTVNIFLIVFFLPGHRVIRVFDREGHLQSTSETVSQLEQSLSWRSSGSSGLITSTISLIQQGRQQVAFYEKNGLRHGEFEIDLGHKVCIIIIWNIL